MKCFWAVTFVLVVFVLHFLLGVIPYFILRLLFLRKAAKKWLSFTNSLTSRYILWILGVNHSVNIDPESQALLNSGEPVCFVSNHTSFLDLPLIICSLNCYMGFITKRAVMFFPFINLTAFALNCIFINRTNRQKCVDGIRKGVNKIKKGTSMLIFPEGTRSKTGVIAPFKRGAFRLAFEAGVPVVPVVIKGVRPALESREQYFTHCKAQLCVLKPVVISSSDDRSERFNKIEDIEKQIRETYASLGDR